MKKVIGSIAILASIMAVNNVGAVERINNFSLKDALHSSAGEDKLNPKIKLYFGKQGHPAISKTLGATKTNKKTNGFGKSDEKACEWALITALKAMQEQAERKGANAIVGIKSNYKGKETSSQTEYVCGSGGVMSGVALKGTMVKVGK
jgi:uncharacterized protein YbjQ (UPF0145 family)